MIPSPGPTNPSHRRSRPQRLLMACLMTLALAGAEDTTMHQRIHEAASTADKGRITEALRLLQTAEGLGLAAQERIDLLCLAMTTAQDKLRDERFVNRLVLDLTGNKAFGSLDASQQDNVIQATLGGERLPFRMDVNADDAYVKDRTVALLRWLSGLSSSIDPHFDPQQRPARHADPPAGHLSGEAPEAIADPAERQKYQEAIAKNTAAINEYMRQSRLRQEVVRATETVRNHIEALTLTKERKDRLRSACAKASGVNPDMLVAVFDPVPPH